MLSVQCEPFPNLTNAIWIVSTNSTVTSAVVECVPGYFLSGQDVVTCTSEGLWDAIPICCKQILKTFHQSFLLEYFKNKLSCDSLSCAILCVEAESIEIKMLL